MDCNESRTLIEKYLEGELEGERLELLERHLQSCPSCGALMERCRKTGDAIRNAFQAVTEPSQAREAVLAKLASAPPERPARTMVLAWRRLAAAAALLIAAVAGFELGQHTSAPGSGAPTGDVLAVSVAEVQGTVLQRHRGSSIWEALTPGAAAYVGDEFMTGAKGLATLRLKDDSTLRLEGNSTLRIDSYNGSAQFALDSGRLKAMLTTPHPPFAISTPQGVIRALGTEFTVTVE